MTDRYVDPSIGSSGTGGSWAQAYKTLKEATDAAAAGETIYFHNGAADTISADTTYACADGVRVISTSDKTNSPPTTYATGATVNSTTTGADVTITGTTAWHGITISLGDSTDSNVININTASAQQTYVDCAFTIAGSGASSAIYIGQGSTTQRRVSTEFINCVFSVAHNTCGFGLSGGTRFIGCDMCANVAPTVLFEFMQYNGAPSELIGCDLSDISTLVESSPSVNYCLVLDRCKLKTGASLFGSTGYGDGEVFVYDCSDTDKHIMFAHYNYCGSTTITESIYVSDNIADSNLSWVVAGTAAASLVAPYESPWIDVYHTGTSAITPSLECVRSGSAAAYTEAQVWSEWLAKTTSGSTRATLHSNRTAPLATPADNETGAKGASDWTGENATSWFGKLQPNASFTPAEVGHISARVCVAGEYTVYVDPQIRGLS